MSILQPFDFGINKCYKQLHKKHLVQKFVRLTYLGKEGELKWCLANDTFHSCSVGCSHAVDKCILSSMHIYILT